MLSFYSSLKESDNPVNDAAENMKCGKILEDYISDGEHLMKGIIEEISCITYEYFTV